MMRSSYMHRNYENSLKLETEILSNVLSKKSGCLSARKKDDTDTSLSSSSRKSL